MIAAPTASWLAPLGIGVLVTCVSLTRPSDLAAGGTDVLAFGGFARTSLTDEQLFSPMSFAVFGFGVDWRLAPHFSVRVAPAYLPRGTEFSHRSSYLRHADFFEVPVLFRASLAPRSALEPYLLLGPTVGIRLQGEEQLYYCWTYSWCEVVIDPSTFRRLDFGAAAAVGIAFGHGAVRPFAEAQWQFGFVDLDPRAGEDAVFRTRAFVARAGLSWRPGAR
jgi:outer membrane protein with beta-barrel domain